MSLLPFWALNMSVALLSMQGFIKNLLIRVLKMNKGLTSLERHEGEWPNWWMIFIFGWTIPLIVLWPLLSVSRECCVLRHYKSKSQDLYERFESFDLIHMKLHNSRMYWGCTVRKMNESYVHNEKCVISMSSSSEFHNLKSCFCWDPCIRAYCLILWSE